MKNEFILHVIYANNKENKLLKEILSKDEIDAVLISEKKISKHKEIFYRIQISPLLLARFKKIIDSLLHYKSLELFEYRMW